MKEKVILVDKNDKEVNFMEKQEATLKAFFIEHFLFLFLTINELLLQRRAVNKYHSGGL